MTNIMASKPQRSLAVSAYGASPAAMEAAALKEARSFFGRRARLEIVPGYRTFAYDREAPEKRYHAQIYVREISRRRRHCCRLL